MRKIEKMMIECVKYGKDMSLSNTIVKNDDKHTYVYLHGNLIFARNNETGKKMYSNCGWCTNVTKSRLNALGAGITQRNYVWYGADGTPWQNGSLSEVW